MFKMKDRVIAIEFPEYGLMEVCHFHKDTGKIQVKDNDGLHYSFQPDHLRHLRTGDRVMLNKGPCSQEARVTGVHGHHIFVSAVGGEDRMSVNIQELTFIRSADDTPCKMLNRDGSECGTCECSNPTQCTFARTSAWRVDDIVMHKTLNTDLPMIVKSIEGTKVLCHYFHSLERQVWFESDELQLFKDFGSCIGDGYTDTGIPVRGVDLRSMTPTQYRAWKATLHPQTGKVGYEKVRVGDEVMPAEMIQDLIDKSGVEPYQCGPTAQASMIGEVEIEVKTTVFVKITPEQLRVLAYDLEKTQEAQSYQNGEQTIFFLYPEKPE